MQIIMQVNYPTIIQCVRFQRKIIKHVDRTAQTSTTIEFSNTGYHKHHVKTIDAYWAQAQVAFYIQHTH